MSVGMKVAIAFVALMGVMILAGVALTLSEIMHRLDRADQAQIATVAPPVMQETEQAITAVANTTPHAYPVPGKNESALALPVGAVVQQIMPYQDGVYLLVSVPRQGQRILILDARSGAVRQDIRLQNSGK